MLKRNAIIKFVFTTIIAILGVLLCVCPFSVPYSTNVYNGFIPAINKGIDLNGGVSAVYECTTPNGTEGNLSKSIDNSLDSLKRMFENEGFSELYVVRQGGNKIVVSASDAVSVNSAFNYIEDGKSIYFTTTQVSDSVPSPDVHMVSSDVYKVYPDYDSTNSNYGITIEFNSQGTTKLNAMKSFADENSLSTLYVYLGSLSSSDILAEVTISDIGDNSLFLTSSSSGSYSITSYDTAREVAYSVAGGTLEVSLKLVEVSNVSATLGKNTLTLIAIALIVIVVLSFVFLYVRYRDLGLLGSLALVFYMILFSFFMQALPFVTLTLAGVFGSVIAYLIAMYAIVSVFEKVKNEYALGKKIHLSCKGGFKLALWQIIDSHVIIALVGFCIWIFSPSSFASMGISIILGCLLSLFTTFVILKSFVKTYLLINSSKAKKLNLYRDKLVKEVKDEEVTIIKEDEVANSLQGGNND